MDRQPAGNGRDPHQAILRAAIKLFGTRGYAATSMRDIANAVGLLPGSLYAHLDSKEALLAEIVEPGMERYLAIGTDVPADLIAVAKLRRAISAHVALSAQDPERSLVVLHQWRLLDEPHLSRALERRKQYRQLYETWVAEGIADGSIRPGIDRRIAVFAILGALNWLPEWYSSSGSLSAAAVGDRLAEVLLGGLAQGAVAP